MGVWPLIPFFEDHVTIFNSSPMQHLGWSFLWQKIGNGWKLLLTVSIVSFVLNVTQLLDPTLECIDKFRFRQQSVPSIIYMFRVSKKHWNNMSNIFKVNNKDTRLTADVSIAYFEHILHFIPLLILLNLNKC